MVTVAQATTIDIPVPNGDFSSPSTSTYKFCVPDSWSDTVDDLGGSGVAVGGMNGSGDQFFFQGLGSQQTAWLYQADIGAAFVAGDSYKLDFDYANGQQTPYTLTANICYNGGNTELISKSLEVAASQDWTHGSVSGIAPSALGEIAIVFQFTATVAGNQQPWLDHVTLTQTTVPEPSTIAMLATSLASLMAYAWRKRK
jgi:hypothetical protein